MKSRRSQVQFRGAAAREKVAPDRVVQQWNAVRQSWWAKRPPCFENVKRKLVLAVVQRQSGILRGIRSLDQIFKTTGALPHNGAGMVHLPRRVPENVKFVVARHAIMGVFKSFDPRAHD